MLKLTRPTSKITVQEIQDKIFMNMSADKKIKITSELTMFCLKLNNLNHLANGDNQSRKTTA